MACSDTAACSGFKHERANTWRDASPAYVDQTAIPVADRDVTEVHQFFEARLDDASERTGFTQATIRQGHVNRALPSG